MVLELLIGNELFSLSTVNCQLSIVLTHLLSSLKSLPAEGWGRRPFIELSKASDH